MARKISMAAALLVVFRATLLQSSYARTYTVGDSTGWRIPNSNSDFYDDWADNKGFVVGDILVFDFTSAQHNVAEVTEADYDSCSAANTIFTVSNGPARITLNRTGDHFFICAFAGHCSGGQKLKVEVRNGTSTSAAPSPAPKSSPITPGTSSPTSSASSLVATLSLLFISVPLVLFC